MTWICPNCERRYPDSGIGVPKENIADEKEACEACDGIPNNGDPEKRTVSETGGEVDENGN